VFSATGTRLDVPGLRGVRAPRPPSSTVMTAGERVAARRECLCSPPGAASAGLVPSSRRTPAIDAPSPMRYKLRGQGNGSASPACREEEEWYDTSGYY